jgi:hypothetical protein
MSIQRNNNNNTGTEIELGASSVKAREEGDVREETIQSLLYF